MAERKRLSAADWTGEAYRALAAGGVVAVAVEALAGRLGATKGSFYWHFTGRDAVLEAALQHWERAETEDVIALVESEPDVLTRLRNLLTIALGGHPAYRAGGVELALQATAGHPLVAPVLARVTHRRISYLADQFVLLGFDPTDARQRGLIAYTAYLGHAQLVHATPDSAPTGPGLQAYVDAVITTLSRP
ncbi:MAG: TetR/AcrR family transcriptional regulator [Pseudonocardia sp.]|nr:TetR/AcrR family transcriptional regulator [Pseudonocardia sp.]